MSVSIKIRKNATRGSTYPGENIGLYSPLNPGGAVGVKFGTNMQGGDGSIEFAIADRGPEGNWPGVKNDAAEVYYGLERVTQHSLFQPTRNEPEGTMSYAGQGHFPHYAKSLWLNYATGQRYVTDWVQAVWLYAYWATSEGWQGSNKNAPFVNSSPRYCDYQSGGSAENPLIPSLGYPESETGEKILADMLKYCDYIQGVFPGHEADPDSLGCYFYYRHRTRDQKAKWYLAREDIFDWKVELDWSKYCNAVVVWYKDSAAATQYVWKTDQASMDKYTPGSREEFEIDLTSMTGYLDATAAGRVGQAYLDRFKEPQAKGSLSVYLHPVQRTGLGRQWSGLIRGGDVVKVERAEYRAFDEANPLDNFNAFLVDSTLADIDAGVIELNMAEPATMETLLTGMGIS